MWLRGDLRSGAVTRGGSSAPTLYHNDIRRMVLLILYYIVRYNEDASAKCGADLC